MFRVGIVTCAIDIAALIAFEVVGFCKAREVRFEVRRSRSLPGLFNVLALASMSTLGVVARLSGSF